MGHLVSGFAGAAAAAFLYDLLATTRLVEQPIIEAVSHDDSGSSVRR
ncbi:MAG: hypothetical protein ACREOY_00775 [Candidatus Dormibacteraceae bacterium]